MIFIKFKSMRILRRMKVKMRIFLAALTTTASFLLSTKVGMSQPGYRHQVNFSCQKIENTPTTVAQVPRQYAPVRIIKWKHMTDLVNQQRCEEVSRKFQQFYDRGRLNYVTYGKVNGYTVICAVINKGEQCNSSNQLFTLLNNNDPDLLLLKLMGMLEGNVGSLIIEENGGREQIYISLEKILNKKINAR